MNKKLFWTGLGFQIIQLTALGIAFLSQLKMSAEVLFGILFILLNVASLVFILLGVFKEN